MTMAERRINIENGFESLNPWVRRSIELFNRGRYLDQISHVYDYWADRPQRLDDALRRQIRMAHYARRDNELIRLLSQLDRFPYDEPFWYLLKTVPGFIEGNPAQVQRIASTLYDMTDEEVVFRMESPPKLNQQTGPMFHNWLRRMFRFENLESFKNNRNGTVILGETEEVGKGYLADELNQEVSKRPDLIAKVNSTIIIGEAKWIGQSGGNQFKSVAEVLKFCAAQRGEVIRIGIIDGYPWATRKPNGAVINDRICVEVQESPYNLMSALLLNDFFGSLVN